MFFRVKRAEELRTLREGDKVFLLAGENFRDLETAIDILRSKKVEFAGAVFPKVMYGREISDDLMMVLRLEREKIFTFRDIDKLGTEDITPHRNDFRSCILFVDGLSPGIRNFLDTFYEVYGDKVTLIGGGAGSITKDIKPIITPGGLVKGGSCGFLLEGRVRFSVGHGWKRLYGPLIATRTEGNRILELNWKPAFEVYSEVLEEIKGIKVSPDNFFDVAKYYPFGMIREGEEDIVRDPIRVHKDMSVECVGDVPENSVLFIMKGEKESLIEGSRATCQIVRGDLRLVFDCVSRTMVLGEHFKEELDNFGDNFVGVLTVGEIAPLSNGYPMFYNKTTVCLEIVR